MKTLGRWVGWAAMAGAALFLATGRTQGKPGAYAAPNKAMQQAFWGKNLTQKVKLSDAQWKRLLPPEQYDVTRQAGTEAPFSGANERIGAGVYRCADCGNLLFDAKTQFDSGTGWPSFYQPLKSSSLLSRADHTLGMDRDEVVCARCGAHLGHVFNDGPKPTGLRYCMNSVALAFEKAK